MGLENGSIIGGLEPISSQFDFRFPLHISPPVSLSFFLLVIKLYRIYRRARARFGGPQIVDLHVDERAVIPPSQSHMFTFGKPEQQARRPLVNCLVPPERFGIPLFECIVPSFLDEPEPGGLGHWLF